METRWRLAWGESREFQGSQRGGDFSQRHPRLGSWHEGAGSSTRRLQEQSPATGHVLLGSGAGLGPRNGLLLRRRPDADPVLPPAARPGGATRWVVRCGQSSPAWNLATLVAGVMFEAVAEREKGFRFHMSYPWKLG